MPNVVDFANFSLVKEICPDTGEVKQVHFNHNLSSVREFHHYDHHRMPLVNKNCEDNESVLVDSKGNVYIVDTSEALEAGISIPAIV